jgi:transcriptional regulator with XRE-family HTH domain
MLYIAENIKSLRRSMDLTQEDVAEMLGVSPQSVSKWERGDTYPDITLLPALAILFKTSIDALVGMDKINSMKARNTIFQSEHAYLNSGDYFKAAEVLEEGLKTFPNDYGMMSDLALVFSLDKSPEKLKQSVMLCERVLSGNSSEKVRHTTRAALCFIYMKIGDKEKAMAIARSLPHVRESREEILAQLEKDMTQTEIDDAYLKFLALGE